jgi:hypothetical protein
MRSQKSESACRLPPAACRLLLVACCSLLSALEFPNPAMVTGTQALGANPAQLASARRPRFAYQLLQVRAGLENNSFSGSQYNRYTGAFLDSVAKQDITGSVPEAGLRLGCDADLDGLALTTGIFGLAVRGHAAASGTIPRDMIDLTLNGNQLGRRYSASNLQGAAIAYSDVTLGFGMPLARGFVTGIGLKYLRGILVAQNTQVDGYLLTLPYVVNSELLAGYRWAYGGSGYGLDWGLTYEFGAKNDEDPAANHRSSILNRHLRIAVALLNLNSGINWTTRPGAAVFKLNLDSVNLMQLASSHGVGATEFVQNQPGAFKTRLPFFVNLGAACEPVRGMTVGLSILEGSQNSALSSLMPAATISAEYRGVQWLPLRAAVTAGGRDGFALEAGLGFQYRGFELQAQIANQGGVALLARGLSARLSIDFQSGGSSRGDVMRLLYDPTDGSSDETTGK